MGYLLEFERRVYSRLRARADRRTAKSPHILTGEQGEDAACFHLRSFGYQIVARRWISNHHRGDIDLIAWDGPTLVLVEVKTRTDRHQIYTAESAVNRGKRNQLRLHLDTYLRHFPEPFRQEIPVRFDIVSVYLLPGGPVCEHYPNAFPRTAPPSDRRRLW